MGSMEPNPYQSPVVPSNKQSSRETDSTVGLLSEIRDMQREMLEISRRNSAVNRFALIIVVILAAVLMVSVSAIFVLRILLPNF